MKGKGLRKHFEVKFNRKYLGISRGISGLEYKSYLHTGSNMYMNVEIF